MQDVGTLSGVYAAVTTPRLPDGSLCERSLATTIEFLLRRGIRGFAFNGASGEYCLTSLDELRRILRIGRELTAGDAEFVSGIGSAGIGGYLERAAVAIDAGAKAVLMPAPHFFSYEQDDLEIFCRRVAEQLPVRCVLYNLPQFTSGLTCKTVHTLITECPNIVGIKDSSGSLDILRHLTQAGTDACRLVGNDGVLAAALQEDICDGVISGVAGVLPELILCLLERRRKSPGEFAAASQRLTEFVEHIDCFPVPWGLKLVAESRGIAAASFAQPLCDRRIAEGRTLQAWFREWQRPASEICGVECV